MQNNTSLVANDTGHSLLHILPSSTSSFGLLCQYLGLLLLILSSSCLAACSVNPSCSSNSSNSSCVASLQPTVDVHQSDQKPGMIQQVNGNAKPKLEHSRHLSHGATANPTPTPIALRNDEEIVLGDVNHYVELVLVEDSYIAFLKAYNLLDMTVRAREPFGKFVKDANYTLSKGCWNYDPRRASATQVNSSTWIVVLRLTKVACLSGTILGLYMWLFRLGMDYGLYEIVAVTLEKKNR